LQSDVFKFPFSFWEGWLGLSKELFSFIFLWSHALLVLCHFHHKNVVFYGFVEACLAVLGFDAHESLSKICLFLSMVARLVSNFDFFDYKKSKLEYL
jgi:hypothetical protein